MPTIPKISSPQVLSHSVTNRMTRFMTANQAINANTMYQGCRHTIEFSVRDYDAFCRAAQSVGMTCGNIPHWSRGRGNPHSARGGRQIIRVQPASSLNFQILYFIGLYPAQAAYQHHYSPAGPNNHLLAGEPRDRGSESRRPSYACPQILGPCPGAGRRSPSGLEPNMLLARVRKIDERIHKFWQAREIAFPQRGNRILPAGRRGSMNPGRQSVGRWRRRCSCL